MEIHILIPNLQPFDHSVKDFEKILPKISCLNILAKKLARLY